MSKANNQKYRSHVIWSTVAFVFVISAWFVTLYMLKDVPDRGTFGDMFGAVNALFSGFAFAGVIIAIILQSQELALQRQELADTREVLKDQSTTMTQQRFENTFFEMLSLHNEIVSSITQRNGGYAVVSSGRDFLKRLIVALNHRYKRECKNESVLDSYHHIYSTNQSVLGHYFRLLYRIIKLVHDSDVENKRIYTDLARAQLSNQELQLLFYNCLTSHGESFKPLVEEYGLLDNLPPENIIDIESLMKRYDAQAYGGKYPL